jgi:polyisoprenoid-binding protein YceI
MKMLFNLVVVMLLANGLSFANNPNGNNPSTETVSYAVDLEASSVEWKAYKVTGEHMGTVNLKSGILMFEGGKLTGGQFEVDMTSINVTDLTGEYKGKLEGHLKSDDFFGVEKNPTASLILTNVIPNGVDRYKIEGDLTIKESPRRSNLLPI